MALSDKYQQASFRGVIFYLRSEDEEGGKKTVSHEYPNTDFRYTEELGRLPSKFSMNAFVHGNDAIDQAESLIRALDTPGIGVLIHPIYGRLQVKSTTWSRSTSETEMGEIKFSLNFEQSEPNVSLTPTLSTKSLAAFKASVARDSLGFAVEAIYAINKAQEVLAEVQAVTTLVMDVVSGKIKSLSDLDPATLAIFDRVLGTSLKDLYQASLDGESFANNLKSFYQSALDTSDPEVQKDLWESLIDYEDDREPGPTDTVKRAAIENNIQVVVGHTQLNALINSYESSAFFNFETVEELNESKQFLEDSFNRIFSNSDTNPLITDNTLRAAILDLRNTVNDVLDQAESNAFKLKTIQPGETSLARLTYDLYGSLDNLDILRELNGGINHSDIKFSDTVEVVN